MKFQHLALTILISFLAALGCTKKAEEASKTPVYPVLDLQFNVTAKTSSSFTVSWNAATDDSTPAAAIEYKLIYSTSDNVNDWQTAEGNGTTAMDWTANTFTKNVTGLSNATTYYIAVLARDTDGNKSLMYYTTATTCAGKKIFLATVPNANFGGKSGADTVCTNARPGGVGTYKAMVSDNTGIAGGVPNSSTRQACSADCTAVNTHNQDWPIAASTTYCLADMSKRVGYSGTPGLALMVPTANILTSTVTKLYIGVNIQYGNLANSSNCTNWSTTAGTTYAGSTDGVYTSQSTAATRGFALSDSASSCSEAGAIVCVEQ